MTCVYFVLAGTNLGVQGGGGARYVYIHILTQHTVAKRGQYLYLYL